MKVYKSGRKVRDFISIKLKPFAYHGKRISIRSLTYSSATLLLFLVNYAVFSYLKRLSNSSFIIAGVH